MNGARLRRGGEGVERNLSTEKLGAWLWVACLQYFVAEVIVISRWPGVYSLRQNYISDLAAENCGTLVGSVAGAAHYVCSPWHAVMNGSFTLQGVLIVAGALLVRKRFSASRWQALALFLVGASGFGVLVVAFAPEDVLPTPHYIGAAENFVCCNVGMALMGVAMLLAARPAWVVGLLSLAFGLIGIAGIALLGAGIDFGLGVGTIERVVAYPFPLWLAGMGMRLLATPEPAVEERAL